MQAFYADHFVLPLPAGHRFPMEKYRMLRDRIAAELPQVRLAEALPASRGELALAHAPAYIDGVFHGTLPAAAQREIGFPWTPMMAERARRSVGATIQAARAAFAEGIAANLAGGTHHASADAGGGYCVFNDLAVTARLMQAEHLVRGQRADHRAVLPAEALAGPPAEQAAGPQARARPLPVWVIDLDVHQGNGTAAIFRGDASVWTLSMHGEKNYPFRKVPSCLDIDLPDGCTDMPYLEALDRALEAMWQAHGDTPPGLVLYQAGADPFEGDRLGRLKISAAGLAERDRRVFAACRERGIPVVLTMGGGYGHVIAETVEVQMGTFRAALQTWEAWRPV